VRRRIKARCLRTRGAAGNSLPSPLFGYRLTKLGRRAISHPALPIFVAQGGSLACPKYDQGMTHPSLTRSLLTAFGLSAFLWVGCGGSGVGKDGDVVGGPCAENNPCAAGSECLQNGEFPGGLCVVSCEKDADCPTGSSCISNEGGVCMQDCTTKDDCRDGYQCEGKARESESGEKKVCNG
jgi:hypothetical protein